MRWLMVLALAACSESAPIMEQCMEMAGGLAVNEQTCPQDMVILDLNEQTGIYTCVSTVGHPYMTVRGTLQCPGQHTEIVYPAGVTVRCAPN